MLVPGGVAEAALGDAAEQLHLAAFEQRGRLLGAGAGPLALGAARRGLAVAAADAAADALLLLAVLVDADVNGGQVHYRVTPRSRATSSRVRSCSRPWMVALTRLIGLVLPWTLVRMLRMPHAFSTSRTPGPALTPVPGPAGTRMTRLPPYLPMTRCGIVSPRSEMRFWRLSVLLGVLGRLLDGRRHLVGLAVAVGDAALVVADDDQGVEAEAPAALDHGGAAADLHDAVFQAVLP